MGQEIRILVINPNTEQKMTDQIEKQIREKLPSDIRLTVRTNVAGPVSIEGHTRFWKCYPILRKPMMDIELHA